MIRVEATCDGDILTFYCEMSKIKMRKAIREEVILWQQQNKSKI